MTPEEFAAVRRPSKKALPGEGAWMTAGASPPAVSAAFLADARRLSNKRRRPSKEQLAGLADRYEAEVEGTQQRRRSKSLSASPSAYARNAGEEAAAAERRRAEDDVRVVRFGSAVLTGDFAGAEALLGELPGGRKASKDSLNVSGRKASKDSLNGGAAAGAPERRGSRSLFVQPLHGSSAQGAIAPRERRSLREVLNKNPQLVADVELARNRRLSGETRSLDPANPEDRAALDDLFLCYDPQGDGTGSLGFREFSRIAKDLGLQLSKAELLGMIRQLDKDGNGKIEIDEFALFFNHAGIRDELKSNVEDLTGNKNKYVRELFEEFRDPTAKGIDFEGLKLVVRASKLDEGENMVTPNELDLFFKRLDVNSTGYITVEKLQFFYENILVRKELKDGLQNLGTDSEDMLTKVFTSFDSSRKGEMNKYDLLATVHFMGSITGKHSWENITQSGVDTLLAKIDTDGNGSVEVEEFIAFFEQIRNEEELIEELDKFRKGQRREKCVQGIGLGIAVALIIAGIYVANTESDSIMLAYSYGAMFVGSVILAMWAVPNVGPPLWGCLVHECISTMNPTKAVLMNLVLTLAIAAVFGRRFFRQGDENARVENVIVMVLSAVLLLLCAAEAAWLGLAYAGLLEAPPDLEAKEAALAEQVAAMEGGASGRRRKFGSSDSYGELVREVRQQSGQPPKPDPKGSSKGGSPKRSSLPKPLPAEALAPPVPKRAFEYEVAAAA